MKWITEDGYIEIDYNDTNKIIGWTFVGPKANNAMHELNRMERILPASLKLKSDEMKIEVLNNCFKCV